MNLFCTNTLVMVECGDGRNQGESLQSDMAGKMFSHQNLRVLFHLPSS